MSDTPRCDKLKSRLPIYNDHGAFKVSTDDAEHWEKLAREIERELTLNRLWIIMECREACLEVHAGADDAAKANDAIGEPYKTGYIDAAIDCDEALYRLLSAKPVA
jgi:hypothetical protein